MQARAPPLTSPRADLRIDAHILAEPSNRVLVNSHGSVIAVQVGPPEVWRRGHDDAHAGTWRMTDTYGREPGRFPGRDAPVQEIEA